MTDEPRDDGTGDQPPYEPAPLGDSDGGTLGSGPLGPDGSTSPAEAFDSTAREHLPTTLAPPGATPVVDAQAAQRLEDDTQRAALAHVESTSDRRSAYEPTPAQQPSSAAERFEKAPDVAGGAEVQHAVDEIQAQGFYGEKADPKPDTFHALPDPGEPTGREPAPPQATGDPAV